MIFILMVKELVKQFDIYAYIYRSPPYVFSFVFILFSFTSFAQQSDSLTSKILDEIVITGTRTRVGFLESPVSVERIGVNEIRQSAHPTFFDAIQNMKGL